MHVLRICICHFKLGVLGPWEFLWRAGSYIFCVCDSVVWSAGPVQFYSGTFLERMAGLYRFFLFLFWLCCSGYGTVEMVRGGGLSSFSLSSVCCQFSWRLDVCGRIFVFYNSIFFGRFFWYFPAVSYFMSC